MTGTPERPLREQSKEEFMGTKCPACGHQFGRIMPDPSKEELVRIIERMTVEARAMKYQIYIEGRPVLVEPNTYYESAQEAIAKIDDIEREVPALKNFEVRAVKSERTK